MEHEHPINRNLGRSSEVVTNFEVLINSEDFSPTVGPSPTIPNYFSHKIEINGTFQLPEGLCTKSEALIQICLGLMLRSITGQATFRIQRDGINQMVKPIPLQSYANHIFVIPKDILQIGENKFAIRHYWHDPSNEPYHFRIVSLILWYKYHPKIPEPSIPRVPRFPSFDWFRDVLRR